MSHTFKIKSGDVFYDVTGQPTFTSTGNEKVSQDLGEAAVSPINDIGFGFGLVDLVGTVQDPFAVPSLIESLIDDGITRLESLQQNNLRLARTDDELINSIIAVQAGFNTPGNKTDYAFSFAVNTVAGDNIAKKGSL